MLVDRILRPGLWVTVFPELATILQEERPLEAAGRSKSFIAGAGGSWSCQVDLRRRGRGLA